MSKSTLGHLQKAQHTRAETKQVLLYSRLISRPRFEALGLVSESYPLCLGLGHGGLRILK